mgnify:CR=1 FL=1
MDTEKIMLETSELINFARLLIYDTDLPNDEKIEKIWNAINRFYDKYEDDRNKTTE